jgi:hypothetical protein
MFLDTTLLLLFPTGIIVIAMLLETEFASLSPLMSSKTVTLTKIFKNPKSLANAIYHEWNLVLLWVAFLLLLCLLIIFVSQKLAVLERTYSAAVDNIAAGTAGESDQDATKGSHQKHVYHGTLRKYLERSVHVALIVMVITILAAAAAYIILSMTCECAQHSRYVSMRLTVCGSGFVLEAIVQPEIYLPYASAAITLSSFIYVSVGAAVTLRADVIKTISESGTHSL